MQSMNRATLMGHVGRDPESRKTQAGDAMLNFSLATTEKFRRRDGESDEATEWHRVVVFGPLAETVAPMVRKGTPLLVEGRIQRREFTDADNNQRSITEIVVSGYQGVVNVLAPKPAAAGDG